MADYYVRTDGNNANDGSADDAAHAWLTVQHALDNTVGTGPHTIHVQNAAHTADNYLSLKGGSLNGKTITVLGSGTASLDISNPINGSIQVGATTAWTSGSLTIQDLDFIAAPNSNFGFVKILSSGAFTLEFKNCDWAVDQPAPLLGVDTVLGANQGTVKFTNCTYPMLATSTRELICFDEWTWATVQFVGGTYALGLGGIATFWSGENSGNELIFSGGVAVTEPVGRKGPLFREYPIPANKTYCTRIGDFQFVNSTFTSDSNGFDIPLGAVDYSVAGSTFTVTATGGDYLIGLRAIRWSPQPSHVRGDWTLPPGNYQITVGSPSGACTVVCTEGQNYGLLNVIVQPGSGGGVLGPEGDPL